MKKIQVYCLSYVLFIVSVLLLPSVAASQSQPHPSPQSFEILILLSYHDTHSWTADVLDGVKDELAAAEMNLDLHVEFMDSKRHKTENVFPQLEELYRAKYRNTRFDLIILSDNNALNFLNPRRSALFPGVPVVFCGINNFTPSLIKGFQQVTGVVEAVDFAGTIELALTQLPGTRHVAIVCDNTPSGRAQIHDIQKIMPEFAGRVEFIELFNQTQKDLAQSLKSLPDKSIIFMLSFYRDADGKQLTLPEQAKFITRHSRMPVYTAWDSYLGFGVVGGVMTNGRAQGEHAAQLGVRILAGEAPEQIAIIEKSPNVPTLDYRVMQHFGLPMTALPAGTVIINKPKSFYTENTRILWTILFVVLSQGLIITVLVLNVRKRKRAEHRLEEQREQLKNTVDERTTELLLSNKELSLQVDNRDRALTQERNLAHIIEKTLNEIYIFDTENYSFLFVNEGARINTGYSLAEFMEMTPVDIKPEIDLASFEEIVAPLQKGEKEKIIFETIHGRKDGSTYPVEVHLQKTKYHPVPVFTAIILDITERKEMAQKYQELVEGTSDLITQVDKEGRFLYSNHISRDIFGFAPEELIEKEAFQFIHPDDQEKTRGWFEECLEKQMQQASIENRQVNQKTGAVHDLLWSANFHYDKHGDIVFINGIGRDITERKKGEAAIRKSEEQWDRTFNSFPDIVTLQDTDLHIIKANQAACDLLGISCDAIAGQPCHELFHGSSEPCDNCPVLDTKKNFTSYSREMYHEKLNKTFLVSAAPVLDEEGMVEYIVHVAKDITDIKESEQERIRLAAAIEQAAEMVVVTDQDGNIQYVNPAFEKLTGYSSVEAVGQNPRILKSGEQDHAFYEKMWATLLQGEIWQGRLINRKKDGSLFEEEASISPVKNSEGQITNYVAVKRDVSKEVALENQLRQSIKMEAVGTMASGIAHDFNNILSGIIGCAEFIQEEATEESQIGQNIAEILAAGKRASDLVRQILSFSRQDVSKNEVFSPHLIVTEALKMLRATLPATVIIEENIDPDCGKIMADPSIIHQIVVNLCTNALHAMPEQKGTLVVKLQHREVREGLSVPPGSFVVITVMDDGCGMKQTTIDRIFEPYFTTKEVGKGTGLGLAIVHGAVEEYNGFIGVESSIGKGTVFSVFLPITKESAPPAVIAELKDREEGRTGSARILIVDDELLLVKINETRLKSKGYQVTALSDSRETLGVFRDNPDSFDLLITDQTMPGLTGAELTRAVLEIKPSLPVIMCTGHSDVVSEEKALSLGIKKYVFKPLHGDELLDAVSEVLAGR
jgi:PAS domain S-box-containing protein